MADFFELMDVLTFVDKDGTGGNPAETEFCRESGSVLHSLRFADDDLLPWRAVVNAEAVEFGPKLLVFNNIIAEKLRVLTLAG